MKIAIVLELIGDDAAAEGYELVNDVLDEGELQELINEFASERDYDIEVKSATVILDEDLPPQRST